MSSQENDRELARLWRIDRTCHEMLRDRGYQIPPSELDTTFESFRASKGGGGSVDRKAMWFSADMEYESGNRIYVHFTEEKSVSKATIKVFVSEVERNGAKRGILVYPEKLSSVAGKTITELAADYALEAFKESELLVNITHHILVPKHSIMSQAEKVALLKRYRLKDTQLPRILAADPVARYYGMKRGQVMKIERASETAGRYITYRICM